MPKSSRIRYKPVAGEAMTAEGTILCDVYVYANKGDVDPIEITRAYLISTKATNEQVDDKLGGRLGKVTVSRNLDYNKVANKVKAALKAGKDPKRVAESESF